MRDLLKKSGFHLIYSWKDLARHSFTEKYANDVVIVTINKDRGENDLAFGLTSQADHLEHRTVDWKSQLDDLPFDETGLDGENRTPFSDSAQFLIDRLSEITEILRSSARDDTLNAIIERSIEWSRVNRYTPLRREDFVDSFFK